MNGYAALDYGRNEPMFLQGDMTVTGIEMSKPSLPGRGITTAMMTIYRGSLTDMPLDNYQY
ncbi:hypothetical protein [Mucilaginibacter paludis]|uniref:hypothetical protein n=1 Tax=Mucilaginibacter paludis TaxID=423351 RepID=UPI0001E9DED1|nr:hypothetical protein [Mucilaginibacter paludis]